MLLNFYVRGISKGLPRRSCVIDIRTPNFSCSRLMTDFFDLGFRSRQCISMNSNETHDECFSLMHELCLGIWTMLWVRKVWYIPLHLHIIQTARENTRLLLICRPLPEDICPWFLQLRRFLRAPHLIQIGQYMMLWFSRNLRIETCREGNGNSFGCVWYLQGSAEPSHERQATVDQLPAIYIPSQPCFAYIHHSWAKPNLIFRGKGKLLAGTLEVSCHTGLDSPFETGHKGLIPSIINSLSISTTKSSREFSKSSEGCWIKCWSIGEGSATKIARESRARLPALPACCFY